MKKPIDNNKEFKHVLSLIAEAGSSAFQKVNEELVLLYFKVGKLVSEKVSTGTWGESVVEELAAFIQTNYPGLKGFNRRGLYRMKQFYEAYTAREFMLLLQAQIQKTENENVSAMRTQNEKKQTYYRLFA